MGDLIALYTTAPEDQAHCEPVHAVERLWTGEADARIEWADSDVPNATGGWERFGIGHFLIPDPSDEVYRLVATHLSRTCWIAWGETFLRVQSLTTAHRAEQTAVFVDQGVSTFARCADDRLVYFGWGKRELVQVCIPEPSPPQSTDTWWKPRAVAATEHLLREHPDKYVRAGE